MSANHAYSGRRRERFSALADPIEDINPWNVVRFRPQDKEEPSLPRRGGFMPGIVVGVHNKDSARSTLIVMPIVFLDEFDEPNKLTEQVLKDPSQMQLMGLLRDDPRVIRAQVQKRIPNGDGFLSSSSFPDGKNLRSVPPHLARVLSRKFEAARNLKAECKARFCTPVYDWGS